MSAEVVAGIAARAEEAVGALARAARQLAEVDASDERTEADRRLALKAADRIDAEVALRLAAADQLDDLLTRLALTSAIRRDLRTIVNNLKNGPST